MISMGIILVIQLIIEIIYNLDSIRFFTYLIINLFSLMLNSMTDIIEKYLGDNDFTIPYIITMGEGIFVFIMNLIYSITIKNPFKQIKKFNQDLNSHELLLLVILFFLYIILSAIINVYKIHCNIFTSPVKRASFHYILIPFYIIYTFQSEDDFKTNEGKQNITFFILSEVLIVFFLILGLIYNEYIILLLVGLSKDTIHEINKRAVDVKDSMGSEYDFDRGGYGVNFNSFRNSQFDENLV